MTIRLLKTACVLLILAAAVRAQTPVTLQSFFQDLPKNFATSGLPEAADLLKVEDQIAGMSADDVRQALPTVVTALGHPDESVQAYAASALFAVSLRADSAELLRPHIGAIGGLFNSTSDRLHYLAALTFVGMKPAPPAEVVQPMLAFLNRTDRDPDGQVSALAALVRLAPENPDVISALKRFMSRPLQPTTRVNTLNAIRTSRVNDFEVRKQVITSLDDADPGVQFAAIDTLTRMGPSALAQAAPALQELVQRPTEAPEVRARANKALQTGK